MEVPSTRILVGEYKGQALVCVYAPVSCGTKNTHEKFASKVEMTLEQLKRMGYTAIILGGDLNVDPRRRDPQLALLRKAAENTGMVWMENEEITYRRQGETLQESTIDHFWVSAEILNQTYHPKVDDSIGLSDHFILRLYTDDVTPPPPPPRKQRFPVYKLKQKSFRNHYKRLMDEEWRRLQKIPFDSTGHRY